MITNLHKYIDLGQLQIHINYSYHGWVRKLFNKYGRINKLCLQFGLKFGMLINNMII